MLYHCTMMNRRCITSCLNSLIEWFVKSLRFVKLIGHWSPMSPHGSAASCVANNAIRWTFPWNQLKLVTFVARGRQTDNCRCFKKPCTYHLSPITSHPPPFSSPLPQLLPFFTFLLVSSQSGILVCLPPSPLSSAPPPLPSPPAFTCVCQWEAEVKQKGSQPLI